MGGVYTDPYQVKVGSADEVLTSSSQFALIPAATDVYCDDFRADMHIGDIWQATVTRMSALSTITSPLTSLEFDTTGSAAKQQQDYMAMSWLAEHISHLDQSTATGRLQAEQMSYALWDVFDSGWNGALQGLSWSNRNATQADLNAAYSAVNGESAAEFANISIYTPDPKHSAQEFLVVGPSPSVPEPGPFLLLAFALALSLTFGVLRRTPGRNPRSDRSA